MMVIHFPAALLPMDFLFGTSAVYFRNDVLYEAAYYCLMAGVLGGWLAVLTGLYDLFTRIMKPGQPMPARALIHAGLQTTMVIGFSIVLSLEYHHPDFIHQVPLWIWAVKGFMILVLVAGNYFGGELVFRHVAKEM
jgi:uncharacterized membrane protein